MHDDVMEQLSKLMFAYRSEMRRALCEAGHELNGMEVRALMWIARHPGGSARDLALHGGRDKAQIARVIQQLDRAGLIVREPDPTDRRQQRLALTHDGAQLHTTLQGERQRVSERMLARLDQDERAQLGTLLERMAGNDDGRPALP